MTVSVEHIEKHVALVEFAEPPHNFFDPQMIWDILQAFKKLGQDGRTRAIVLASPGKHFCAGANFRKSRPDDDDAEPIPHLYDIGIAIMEQPLPVVAALQGSVVGGGLGMALAADFRVSTPESRLTANFARIGFHHGFGLTATLPRIVGHQKATELLYTGRDVMGDEAYAIGLVDRLSTTERVRDDAIAMAAELAQSAPLALRSIRATMRRSLVAEFREAVYRELAEQDRLRGTNDFKLGVQAKRGELPDFQGN